MPLHDIKQKDELNVMAIWHITETSDALLKLINLSKEDLQKVNNFRLEKRKQEWLASRVLLNDILGFYPQTDYSENGKPFLRNNELHISISHTNKYAAVCVSQHPTSLDIEICAERIERVINRFIHDNEKEYIPYEQRLEYYTIIWSAKEALFKYFDVPAVIFKEHFFVHPFKLSDIGVLTTEFNYKGISRKIKFKFEATKQYTLVYHL